MGNEKEENLGDNRIDDISWFCSLSESELLEEASDETWWCNWACTIRQKIDLMMLRALGFFLVEHLRVKVKDSPLTPGLVKSAAFLDCSNLLKPKLDDVMSVEELTECIEFTTRKDFCKRPRGKDAAVSSSKRLRSGDQK